LSFATGLTCLNCGASYPIQPMFEGCPNCRTDRTISNLIVDYDFEKISRVLTKGNLANRPIGMWKYLELLPVSERSNIVTLQEGGTPLLRCERLGRELGLKRLYVKDESRNPTWSFKDRYCSSAVSKALDFKAKVVTIASSGNAGAATAAYANVANIVSVVFTMGFKIGRAHV
jgi:threonine synthase